MGIGPLLHMHLYLDFYFKHLTDESFLKNKKKNKKNLSGEVQFVEGIEKKEEKEREVSLPSMNCISLSIQWTVRAPG